MPVGSRSPLSPPPAPGHHSVCFCPCGFTCSGHLSVESHGVARFIGTRLSRFVHTCLFHSSLTAEDYSRPGQVILYLSIDGHLGCFLLLAVAYRAVVSICVQVFV